MDFSYPALLYNFQSTFWIVLQKPAGELISCCLAPYLMVAAWCWELGKPLLLIQVAALLQDNWIKSLFSLCPADSVLFPCYQLISNCWSNELLFPGSLTLVDIRRLPIIFHFPSMKATNHMCDYNIPCLYSKNCDWLKKANWKSLTIFWTRICIFFELSDLSRRNLDISNIAQPKWIIFVALYWTKKSSSVTKGSHPVSCSHPFCHLKVWNQACQNVVRSQASHPGRLWTFIAFWNPAGNWLFGQVGHAHSRVISFTKLWRTYVL